MPRAVSRETTFQQDLEEPDEIRLELVRLTHELMGDLERDGRPVTRVTVKVRFVPFFTQQRSVEAGGTDARGRSDRSRSARGA